MEQRELLLLEKYAAVNPELKELWEDHILYEKQVEKLEAKAYRTPTEEQTLKQLKKQKRQQISKKRQKKQKKAARNNEICY